MALFAFATGSASAQSYLGASGSPTFVAPQPVEQGFTDNANGNLHLEFVLGSYPQRATSQPLPVNYVYDSNMIWNIGCTLFSCSWAPSNYNSYGWRLATNAGTLTGTNCGSGACTEWIFTDSTGTSRYFQVSTGTCPIPNAYAADSSGYMLNLCQTGVYAPDGTLVYSAQYLQPAVPGAQDSNGNYAPWGTGDTLGRSLPTTVLSCNGNSNQTCYKVPNSQGSTSTYTVAIATINVQTNFGQTGVSEFTGTMNVVQSIALPDGTNSYTFKYDCDSGTGNPACGSPSGQSAYYGLLTSMTLPTLGVVSYGYTTFSDSYSNKSRWLNSRQTVNGSWSYSPQVISTCSPTQVGCQQKVTVTQPSGDYSVYTFTLNNGAWPVQIQTYDSSSNLLTTVNNTFDFSQACPFTNCHGAAYIRLSTAQTTVSTPSGSITKQTKYQYDSPQTGNITANEEWGFYSGTSPNFPSVPDRAIYTTYLSTGTNDIDRALSVTLCNNSGTDPACPGGGSKVAQTLSSYDNYSGCPSSGLAVVNGIMNHDDTNFGGSYTTRGNVTQINSWVSGSTYLTRQLCYDTTGQITRHTDPKGNITTYGYTDQFYSDNGSNSLTAYTPSKPTNAYLTGITLPLIGTGTMAYFYGSGNQAFSTDPNGATGYSHFMDPYDRSTEHDYALTGWDKTVYTSATQADIYLAVADTTPSVNCQSCQHKQLVVDSFGRKISDKLANYPNGSSNVDTAYDSLGRIYSVSHPYQGSSGQVYEYYHYDGLSRTTQDLHPDNQYVTAAFGVGVSYAGGVSSQQGSPTTYGYGYPTLFRDEVGKVRQEWKDAFGRIIEVDEPSLGNTQSSGSVTIYGTEQSVVLQRCTHWLVGGDCANWQNYTRYDTGTVTVTVNGVPESTTYGSTSTSSSIASSLASAFNTDPNSVVTATVSGSTLTLVSIASGSTTEYTLSATSSTNDPTDFGGPSFTTSTSGANLTSNVAVGSLSMPVATFYIYDAADNVTQVIQGVQTRTYTYDGLGRPTSISTPEAQAEYLAYIVSGALCSGDPENTCQKTDARGVVTTYSYDSLNRLVGKTYTIPQGSIVAAMPNVCTTSTGQSANTCYFYDQGGSSAFALGRRTQMVDPSGSETYTYDMAGRIKQVTKVIGGQNYTSGYKYNAADELIQITYPSGRTVQLSYNLVGQLCEIAPQTSSCGNSGSPYATGYLYNASGQLTNFNYGNGVSAAYSYSPIRSQLSSLSYANGSQNLFKLNYYFALDSTNCPAGSPNNDGQIQCITDSVQPGRTVSYTFDALGRLNTAITNGLGNFAQWGLSWGYDRYGNRLNQTVTAGSGYGNALSFGNPGGAQTNQPDGWCFDASGNLLGKTAAVCPPAASNFIYDGENRMVADPAANESYTYDGNGTRVQKCQPNCGSATSSRVYVFSGSRDIAEYDNGAAPASPSREFIYSDSIPGAGLLATISGGSTPTTTYFHDDHLDWRISTDGTPGSPTYGQVNGQQGHYPFGESWYSSSGNQFVFTSYQRDSESLLDYAMARYYDSSAGRFCSADPLGGQANDPQTWNRYAYVRNDPINLTDPGGQGFLHWLLDILMFFMDLFTGGATTPESIQLGINLDGIQALATAAEVAHQGFETNAQGQKQSEQQPQSGPPLPPPPPAVPAGYTRCGPAWFLITGIGPHQAVPTKANPTGNGAGGYPPTKGDVAFNPHNLGMTDKEGADAIKNDQVPIFEPHWDTAQIPSGNGTGTVEPSAGMPSIPKGLPVGVNDTLPGTDIINGANIDRASDTNNRIDLYRYKTRKQANASTRRVQVYVWLPPGSKAKCPQ